MSTTTLSCTVTAAIARAAKRINSYISCDVAGMKSIMAEELAPVLATAAFEYEAPALVAQGRGCIGTRYCHSCRISYGGTCLCAPIKCHKCKAECGTTPPADGQTYEHRMHY